MSLVPAARRRVVAALLALFAIAALTVGCGKSTPKAPPPSPQPDALERMGRAKDLRVHLPPSTAPRPYPLVVALHTLYHTGAEAEQQWSLDALADRAGFAVVYPDAGLKAWNAGSCCAEASQRDSPDVAFVRAVISHLERRLPIDHRRVLLIGTSNGGMLAYRYGCEHASEIAGMAVVTGSLQVATCRPDVPITVVAVNGLKDQLVPYQGTVYSTRLETSISSAADSLAPFRTIANCAPPGGPVPTVRDRFPVTLETVCGADVRIVQYVLPANGHGWPPSRGRGAFNTPDELWQVLATAQAAQSGPDI
jgi:poly(3-hydroxybutyrate) depolymerase